MRTMKTKMTLAVGTIGTMLLFTAGCGSGGSGGLTHVYENGSIDFDVPAGSCAPVSGPFSVPTGADMDYAVNDDAPGTDDMDVGIINDADGCDFTAAYGYRTGVLSPSDSVNNLVGGSYDFVVECFNADGADCQFGLDWSATY